MNPSLVLCNRALFPRPMGAKTGLQRLAARLQNFKTARKAAPASVKAPAVSKAGKAARNDIREFAAIAIGGGVDAAIRMDKTHGAFLETPGAGLAEFRGFVEALALRHFNADALLLMGASKAPGQSCAGMNIIRRLICGPMSPKRPRC